MSVKQVEVDNLGPITLQKRRGSKNLRISISSSGQIKVVLPVWAPYKLGLDFARSKQDWILKHRPKPYVLKNETRIGKAHWLHFTNSNTAIRPSSRIKQNAITVFVPTGMKLNDPSVQTSAKKATIRALKLEAEQLLPPRLKQHALKHEFVYKQVNVKRLTSRWGSCDSNGNITLNCYLMQLPWPLIDYVLLHELTHTKIMAHGPKFWNEISKFVNNLSDVRKQMRTHRPSQFY